jgi:predicted HTH transcriptional regulator
VEELRRVARGEAYDEQPLVDLDSEALDFRAASESFVPIRKLSKRDLMTLRLLTDYQGRRVPTVGGFLLFGRDRERLFPDAWVQAGRFAGANKSHISDRAEIRSLPVSRLGLMDPAQLGQADPMIASATPSANRMRSAGAADQPSGSEFHLVWFMS